MHRPRLAVIIAGVLATISLLGGKVIAQESPVGITVTPGVIKTKVSKDLPVQKNTVTIRNNYKVPVRLSAELKDIDANSTRIMPGGDLGAELKSSLVLSDTDISIPPLSDVQIDVQAIYGDALRPGGHYATLVLSEQSTGGNTLMLRSAISIAIFLTNQEGVSEHFTLSEFTVPHSLFALPKSGKITLKNDGNVHSVPRGVLKLENSSGQVLAQGQLNASSNPVLPGKDFTNNVEMKGLKSSVWPQKIKILFQFHGETSDQMSEATKTIWYIPPFFLVIVLCSASLLTLLWKFRRTFARKLTFVRQSLGKKTRKKQPNSPKQIHDVIRIDNNRGRK